MSYNWQDLNLPTRYMTENDMRSVSNNIKYIYEKLQTKSWFTATVDFSAILSSLAGMSTNPVYIGDWAKTVQTALVAIYSSTRSRFQPFDRNVLKCCFYGYMAGATPLGINKLTAAVNMVEVLNRLHSIVSDDIPITFEVKDINGEKITLNDAAEANQTLLLCHGSKKFSQL